MGGLDPGHPAQLDELLDAVAAVNPNADSAAIVRAYEFSARMHAEQKRRSGEPYVTHPLSVALIIAKLKLDTASVITGLLHDVVEDTAASLQEVAALFGDEVATLVDGATKVSRLSFQSRQEKQAENFRKMIIAMTRDIRVVLIKLADRLHNMRTLSHLPPEQQREVARETLEIYAAIAHRLGIYWLKSELEDIAFRYLNPPAYDALEAMVAKTRVARKEYVEAVVELLKRRLAESGLEAEITGRPKSFYSIHCKMREEGLSFDEVYDAIAFRVIVGTLRECYEVLGLVHASWKPVPGRFKDYVALPKVNGYQSLHTTVIGPGGQRMEVQIRTREMHRVAEEGIAAHWNYKEGFAGGLEDAQRFAWLRRLLEWQQNLNDPQEFLSTLKDDLFPEQVFVFTPKGDVLDFPRGATAIDFAYRIHSEVGHHLYGARINSRLVPLRYALKSGDRVEVITSERAGPNRDWLNYVVTARAKNKIRQWLRAREAERSVKLGLSLLDRELEPLGLCAGQLRAGHRFAAALKEFSYKDVDALLASVGYGVITAAQVLAKVLGPEELARYRAAKRPAPVRHAGREGRSAAEQAVTVSGVDGVLVRFAGCCSPVAGDEITGFITRGRGVTIHQAGCPVGLLAEPARRVPVVWRETAEVLRPVKLEVVCLDQPGLLAAITNPIAAAGVNISHAEVKPLGADGRAQLFLEIRVAGARQLNELMGRIAATQGVMRVERLGLANGRRLRSRR